MNILPALQEKHLFPFHNSHGAADFGARHIVGPAQVWRTISAEQVDLGFSVTADVGMSRQVVIAVDDIPEAFDPQDGDRDGI